MGLEEEYKKQKRQDRFRTASVYWGRGFLSFCAPAFLHLFLASRQLWFFTFSPAHKTQTRQPATQEGESAGQRCMPYRIILARIGLVGVITNHSNLIFCTQLYLAG